jgi:hypothetical protein
MKIGACKRKGVVRCDPDPTKDSFCDFAGAQEKDPEHEVCDGVDNDCDGVADESWDNPDTAPKCSGERCRGVRDEVVQVGSTSVYRYEASRVDATAELQGSSSARPCSRPSVMPWSLVNYEGARAACAKIGMRLCSAGEWGDACKSNHGCGAGSFPYGCSFDPGRCNGAERGAGASVPGGSLGQCTTNAPEIFDLSGNVAEWTSEQRGTFAGRRIFVLRGGSFNNYEPALRCDATLLAFAEDYAFLDAGFRCCSSCAPGQAECGGACVDLGSNDDNCGGCGVICGSPKKCRNGHCE